MTNKCEHLALAIACPRLLEKCHRGRNWTRKRFYSLNSLFVLASASTKYLDCDPGKWLEEQFSAIRKKIGSRARSVELVNVVHAEVSALVKWLKVMLHCGDIRCYQ